MRIGLYMSSCESYTKLSKWHITSPSWHSSAPDDPKHGRTGAPSNAPRPSLACSAPHAFRAL
eukprot:3667246-Pleurochrysis_carterae.AAC.4